MCKKMTRKGGIRWFLRNQSWECTLNCSKDNYNPHKLVKKDLIYKQRTHEEFTRKGKYHVLLATITMSTFHQPADHCLFLPSHWPLLSLSPPTAFFFPPPSIPQSLSLLPLAPSYSLSCTLLFLSSRASDWPLELGCSDVFNIAFAPAAPAVQGSPLCNWR